MILLNTKIQIPKVHQDLVLRQNLLDRIEKGRQSGSRLTLLSAPAGSGKTTLVLQWLQSIQHNVAWYALDTADNTPRQFIAYIMASIQSIDESIVEESQAMMNSSQQISVEMIWTTLLNNLGDLKQPLILLLDDYHVIENSEIHALLMSTLEHAPRQFHIMMTTRNDPPFPLSRLRSRRLITDIRMRDLRFMDTEIDIYFEHIVNRKLSKEDRSILEARTEGWVTGLQLVAVTLEHNPDQSAYFNTISANNRYILDYLVEEVLNQQSDLIKTFLLKTSILNRLHPDLCRMITDISDTNGILRELERRNLFIRYVGESGEWLEYHQLFSATLNYHLQQEYNPEQLSTLHLQAANWYMQQDMLIPATDHFFEGKYYIEIVDLIERFGDDLSRQGEFDFLDNIIARLPDNYQNHNAKLQLILAIVYGDRLDITRSWQHIYAVETILNKTPDEQVEAQYCAARGTLARLSGDMDYAMQLFTRSQQLKPNMRPTVWDDVHQGLALLYFNQGELDDARSAIEKSIQINQRFNNLITLLYSYFILAEIQIDGGKVFQAEQTYLRALDTAKRHGRLGELESQIIQAGYASLLWEWNKLDDATQYAQRGYEFGKPIGGGNVLLQNSISLIRIYLSKGAFDDAHSILTDVLHIIRQTNNPIWETGISAYHARYWLKRWQVEGNTEDIKNSLDQWYQTLSLRDGNWHKPGTNLILTDHAPDFVHITLARFFIYKQDYFNAESLLSILYAQAEKHNRIRSVIECLMLMAVVQHQLGYSVQASQTLAEALTLAQSRALTRMFIDEAPSISSILEQIPADSSTNSFVKNILENSYIEQSQHMTIAKQGLVETLSQREIEILSLVADGMTNKLIAGELFIAVGTVKRHMSNIHGKLNVENRTQAVARARSLKILL